MCGLAGCVRPERDPDAPARIQRALGSLKHRGPDGNGWFAEEGAWLAHTRLAFLDLSEGGKQPMADASGRYLIIFNGEIYNFRELRAQYCANDDLVNPRSDTSILLELFRQFGRDCLPLLNGMFAFAVYDRHTRTIFLARDRFGEKPLYWTQQCGAFLFASELKTLRTCFPDWTWKLNREGHAKYLVFGNIPPPHTIYENVQAVPPGSWVCWSEAEGVTTGKYWSLACSYAARSPSSSNSLGEVRANVRSRLIDAARSRLVSDVPVGLFLSGGLDSGSLLGLCSTLEASQQMTLCIDFAEKDFSEFHLASKTAAHYRTQVSRVEIGLDDFHSGIDRFFGAMDQPTSDGYNTFFVCQAAKSAGLKAWLSGVGGDELFGGYRSFTRLSKLKWVARALRYLVPSSLRASASRAAWRELRIPRVLHLGDAGVPAIRAHQALRGVIPWRNAELITTHEAQPREPYARALDNAYPDFHYGLDGFQWASLCESHIYMGSQLLRDIDNFSMCFSLELRAPFLDHELFEYVFALPSSLKRDGRQPKSLLCSSLPNPLPKEVLRQPKRGFNFPVSVWLRGGLSPSPEDVLSDGSMKDIWDTNLISKLLTLFRQGHVHWSVIWSLYAFARWRQINPCGI